MAGKTDKVKGRVKEAAGALANDASLKRKGKLDQLAGTIKEGVETVVDTVRDTLTSGKKSRRSRSG